MPPTTSAQRKAVDDLLVACELALYLSRDVMPPVPAADLREKMATCRAAFWAEAEGVSRETLGREMETKYTQGPWEVIRPEWGRSYVRQRRDPLTIICDMNDGLSVNGPTPADAVLIAAAPEMLAALQQCAAQFRFYEAEHLKKGAVDKAETNGKFAALCEGVIGKATGAEPKTEEI